ncbi:hypothetical protein KEM56_007127 [Ascosphaera pollenicola]|nr:hypothetical protein KEM56_007127 [Ascosphaera pollenicola]
MVIQSNWTQDWRTHSYKSSRYKVAKSTARYHLERYGDARCALDAVRSTYPQGSKLPKELASLDVWEMKAKMQISWMGEGDQTTLVTVKTIPDITLPSEDELRARYQAEAASNVKGNSTSGNDPGKVETKTGTTNADATAKAASDPVRPQPASQNVRHEWYQTHDDLVLTFYAKGISKEQAQFDIRERSFELIINLAPTTDYTFTLDPLCYPIDPEASSYKIMSMKIEVRLKKKTSGQKWSVLEGNKPSEGNEPIQPTLVSPTTQSGPSYPTSSRKGAKDWDKVAAELVRKEKEASAKAKKAEEMEKAEGTTGNDSDSDSDYGADPVDKFFKRLYAGADPDTRRAMMKSYVESEGTALSTNWEEVAKKKIEPHND